MQHLPPFGASWRRTSHVCVRCFPEYEHAAWHSGVAWPSFSHVHAFEQLPPLVPPLDDELPPDDEDPPVEVMLEPSAAKPPSALTVRPSGIVNATFEKRPLTVAEPSRERDPRRML